MEEGNRKLIVRNSQSMNLYSPAAFYGTVPAILERITYTEGTFP
jgi:hypothetical protein